MKNPYVKQILHASPTDRAEMLDQLWEADGALENLYCDECVALFLSGIRWEIETVRDELDSLVRADQEALQGVTSA